MNTKQNTIRIASTGAELSGRQIQFFVSDCCHSKYIKRGKSRGRQRYQCTGCRKTVCEQKALGEKVFLHSRIDPNIDEKIVEMLKAGGSIRGIAKALGVTRYTVSNRRQHIFSRDIHEPQGCVDGSHCFYCGKEVHGDREFKRRTSRVGRMFCNAECFQTCCVVENNASLTRYLVHQLKEEGIHMSKKVSKTKSIATTSDLRGVLLTTIQGVRDGEIDHKQGNTIASLSKAVLQSAKLDFEVFKFHETDKVDKDQKLKAISLDT